MNALNAQQVGNLHPVLKDRLHRSRSVFSPGHRIKMNVLPMFLNILFPWVAFMLIVVLNSFWVMHTYAGLGNAITGVAIFIWGASVLIAINRRKYDPDPAWFMYFAVVLGIAVFGAKYIGTSIFNNYTKPYLEVKDLKVIGHLDASKERGQNVMDAGIVYFSHGDKIDATRSWHFKQGSVYCVAPIIKGESGKSLPETQSFDFWAVGKDCCSESSSDFRCGAYNNPLARSGIRILGEEREMYRLAVEQTETLYGIMASHPVFFTWSQDPLAEVNSWNARGWTLCMLSVIGSFVVFLLGVSCASCKFAWLGREEHPFDDDVLNSPGYRSTP